MRNSSLETVRISPVALSRIRNSGASSSNPVEMAGCVEDASEEEVSADTSEEDEGESSCEGVLCPRMEMAGINAIQRKNTAHRERSDSGGS